MIVFINGSFGSGKTTVAQGLNEKVPNSLLYDPEEVGFMLRSILKSIEWSGDFQDYPIWRTLVPLVGGMLEKSYGRTLIIPMTIWNKPYFTEVTNGLREIDPDFHHFCLVAPLETIRDRIKKRGEQEEGHWVYDQAEKCVAAFEDEMFEERIDSTAKTPEEIVDFIISRTR